MKVFLLFCLVAAASALPTELQGGKNVSPGFQALLEKLRDLMKNGDPDKGIPVLDPLELDKFAFSFNADDMLSADISATDINLSGVSDFVFDEVRISALRLEIHFDFTLPQAVLKTDTYKMKGMLFGALPIYGQGQTHFEISNFHVKGFLKIAVGLSGITARDLKLQLNLESLKSETTGMLGGGDIDNVINAIIGDLASEFFNKFSDAIADKIKDVVIPIINEVLEGWTLKDLLDLIGGN